MLCARVPLRLIGVRCCTADVARIDPGCLCPCLLLPALYKMFQRGALAYGDAAARAGRMQAVGDSRG